MHDKSSNYVVANTKNYLALNDYKIREYELFKCPV